MYVTGLRSCPAKGFVSNSGVHPSCSITGVSSELVRLSCSHYKAI